MDNKSINYGLLDKRSVIYGLVGLFTGGAITALLMTYGILAPNQGFNAAPPIIPTTFVFSQVSIANPIDRHFIERMISHHEGAVDMAELALSRAQHPEIKTLANAIKETQTQEIQQMQTWYQQWYGTNVPAYFGNWRNRNTLGRGLGRYGMGMGGRYGMGMMGTDLAALKNAPNFDREFIEQMIPHHEMAIMMASMVLDRAEHPEIQNLAQSIIRSQSTEIEQMQQWYQTGFQ
jgi:uncharacterized protein (DUF305 family)